MIEYDTHPSTTINRMRGIVLDPRDTHPRLRIRSHIATLVDGHTSCLYWLSAAVNIRPANVVASHPVLRGVPCQSRALALGTRIMDVRLSVVKLQSAMYRAVSAGVNSKGLEQYVKVGLALA